MCVRVCLYIYVCACVFVCAYCIWLIMLISVKTRFWKYGAFYRICVFRYVEIYMSNKGGTWVARLISLLLGWWRIWFCTRVWVGIRVKFRDVLLKMMNMLFLMDKASHGRWNRKWISWNHLHSFLCRCKPELKNKKLVLFFL